MHLFLISFVLLFFYKPFVYSFDCFLYDNKKSSRFYVSMKSLELEPDFKKKWDECKKSTKLCIGEKHGDSFNFKSVYLRAYCTLIVHSEKNFEGEFKEFSADEKNSYIKLSEDQALSNIGSAICKCENQHEEVLP